MLLQGPGGDSVSPTGHGASTPPFSSGCALWQRPEQVTWGHQTSRGWCCALTHSCLPDKRRSRECHGGRGRRHLLSHVPQCLSCASLQLRVCCWPLRCGEPCTAPPTCLSAHQPACLPGKDTSPVSPKPLSHYSRIYLGEGISSGDSGPKGGDRAAHPSRSHTMSHSLAT